MRDYLCRKQSQCFLFLVLGSLFVSSCASHDKVTPVTPLTAFQSVIPKPVSATPGGKTFTVTATTGIYVDPNGGTEATAVATYLAEIMRPSTGFPLTLSNNVSSTPSGSIVFTISNMDPTLGKEGYSLNITEDVVTLTAVTAEGLFRGVQTIRQLLPSSIEMGSKQSTSWSIETGTIRDLPTYGWRGTMLDVSRHFFSVQDVERCIDLIAYYKLNTLHLHLTDDQGWRIEIKSWPQLTKIGSSTEVGGGQGGYYSQSDFSDIVTYARQRYVTIVPEIDMPGHVTAALASYGSLNCSGQAKALYTGTAAGISSLCLVNDTLSYQFANDVISELAAITPGPYLHIGGDESTVPIDRYIRFINYASSKVNANGKTIVGWEDISQGTIGSNALVQHWSSTLATLGVQQGAKVIMSPDNYAYFDQKYDPQTPVGQTWAGYIDVQQSYNWDPATVLPGVTQAQIAGVEAPLWTETIQNISQIELMLFPRLAGIAEIGWSVQSDRNWDNYKGRLATHGPRLDAMGVSFYKSSQIKWP